MSRFHPFRKLHVLGLASLLVSPLWAQAPRLLPRPDARTGGLYLHLEGPKIHFPGESTHRRGWSEVSRVSYQVISPRDPQSGMPTGQRKHSPVVIVKPVGSDSVLFFGTITTNMNLKTVVLEWIETAPNTTDLVSYRIQLTNANMASYRQFTEEGRLMEEISFTFQKIEETWVPTGATALDDWEARN